MPDTHMKPQCQLYLARIILINPPRYMFFLGRKSGVVSRKTDTHCQIATGPSLICWRSWHDDGHPRYLEEYLG
ncbi:hypothetical protein SCLCIDRAFT_304753 [Scleroderma citrinum Foug A]|uniref:Uncharacterized protein n=1 Tax=Scleroderma citrinum Foug A TaxID=1036808 RepID=A0A0C3D3I5_9AGAM|nr:hypothetical protein SCLCIDRAFT_304753 [Scleroderma citrinum Foug A]